MFSDCQNFAQLLAQIQDCYARKQSFEVRYLPEQKIWRITIL